jgi:hypothetical protein
MGAQRPLAHDPAPAQLVAEAFGEQMVELIERARQSEARASEAERQLATLRFESHALIPASQSAPELRGSGLLWGGWGLSGVLLAAGVAGYLLGYRPLESELAAARKTNQDQEVAQSEGVAALRAEFARERQALEEQLSAARQAAAAATTAQPVAADAEPQPVGDVESEERTDRARSRATSDEAAESDETDGPRERTPEQEARREARLAARAARREEREAKRAERAAKREERANARAERSAASNADDDDDETETPRAKSSSARDDAPAATRPSAPAAEDGDDPLEGLDGL